MHVQMQQQQPLLWSQHFQLRPQLERLVITNQLLRVIWLEMLTDDTSFTVLTTGLSKYHPDVLEAAFLFTHKPNLCIQKKKQSHHTEAFLHYPALTFLATT